MPYLVIAIYVLVAGFCTWRIWQGDKSRALMTLFIVSILFLLNALHWGFIFTNEPEDSLTSFGAALRFAFADIQQEPTFDMLVKYCIIRLLIALIIVYTAFFAWQKRVALQIFLKRDDLQKSLMASAVFLSFSVMGIMTGISVVHIFAALAWGVSVYWWPKSEHISY